MALTRAQLLMGDSGQGPLLSGQVQAVKAGAGITIGTDGVITVNSQTIVGVMKLGQTAALASGAYNGYNWPASTGTVGQQITIASVAAGVTTLAWDDPDMIPWTAKGQLVVGTGANNQTILNVGTDGQILIADSTSASGLSYTSNYVSTSGATGAANIPAGTTGQQPLTPATGALRYNSTTTSLEFYNGTNWETVASSSTNGFVEQTSATGAAVIPAGLQAARPGAPTGGYFRFNDTTDLMEFHNGTAWQSIASSATGAFVAQSVPTTGTASAIVPSGTTAQQQTAPAPAGGYLRYNADSNNLEFFNTTSWVSVGGGIPDLGLNLSSTNSLLKASTPVATTPPTAGNNAGQAITGSMYWDAQYGALFVRYADANSSQWVMVNGNNVQTGTLDFPNGPAAGATYTAPNGLTYTYDGTKGVWTCPAGGAQVGLGVALNGGFVKVSIPVATTPPTAGTTVNQAMDGSLYWDSNLSALFIRYNDGVTTQWVQATPSGNTLQAATLAEAAAGTLFNVYSSPQTAVPKDAAGMTGAAIIPGGTNAQQPGTPVGGMLRMNTDYTPDYLEVYNAELSAWKRIAYEPDIVSVTDYTATNGSTLPTAGLYRNITIPAGVTCSVPSSCYLVATGTVTINGTVNGVGAGLPGARGSYANNSMGFANPFFNLQGNFGQGIGTGNNLNNIPLPGRSYGFYTSLAGSSGSSGDIFAELNKSVAGSQGGYAGGTLIVKCLGAIQVGASAVINMSGSSSIAVTLGVGNWGASAGAGGGSGGLILLQSISSLTLAAGSTLNVSGGNGSNGVTTSGGVAPVTGGGGGGGGYIVLNSPSTSDSSTKVVSGGAGGSTVNSNFSGLNGGSGGGFGGDGGAGGSGLGPAAAGSNGQTLFNTYI